MEIKSFSYYFCLLIEGSGSVPLTNGSGSGRPKNLPIRSTVFNTNWNPNINFLHQKPFMLYCSLFPFSSSFLIPFVYSIPKKLSKVGRYIGASSEEGSKNINKTDRISSL